MAEENSITRGTIDIHSELYLHPMESPSFVLASQKLNAENFSQWRRSAEIALSARNKLGFVTGSTKAPDPSSPLYQQWIRCNNLVISWILHSVEAGIASSILYCETAQEIWEDLAERFSQSNAPRLYQLHKEMVTLVQGSDSVCEYFTKLKGLWDTYLTMITLPHCKCDGAESYYKLLQNQQLMQFLMGLNDCFKVARGNILMMMPLPSLNQAYKLISQEETQKDCTTAAPLAYESTALATVHPGGSNKPVYGTTPSGKKSKFFCQHCKVFGHSIDRCFKIHGYPKSNRGSNTTGEQGFNQGKKLAGNAVTDGNTEIYPNGPGSTHSNESNVSLTPAQYSQLIALLSKENVDNSDFGNAPGFFSSHMASSAQLAGSAEEDFSGGW